MIKNTDFDATRFLVNLWAIFGSWIGFLLSQELGLGISTGIFTIFMFTMASYILGDEYAKRARCET